VADTRPTTHADMWLMRRLGPPVLSPDGTRAVVSVTEPSYVEEETTSDLWLISVDGEAPPRRLTSTAPAESDAAWSPDGTRLAFATKRKDDESAQIYVLDMTGPGEAQRVTSLSTGAAAPVWSPDGTRIAFESRVYSQAVDDDANRKRKKELEERDYDASAYENFPIRHWDHWLDERQVHLFVQEAVAGAAPRDLLAGTALVAEVGFDGHPTLSNSSLQAVWAPEGDALVFVATTNRNEAAYASSLYALYRVGVDGRPPERLTEGTTSYFEPRFALDGRSLLALSEMQDEQAYHLDRLVRFSWPVERRPPIRVSPDFDRSPAAVALSADGGLFFLAADTGRVRVFHQPDDAATPLLLDEDSRGEYAGLEAPRRGTARHLVARYQDSAHPAEIVRIDARTGEHVALTSFNRDRVRDLDWRPFEEMWITSSKGRRIHSWIAFPPGFDESRKYPLVVMIHGGPHASSTDAGHVRWSPQLLAAPGYVVVMPDYTGSVGYGEEFGQAIQGDPLRTPGEEILEVVDAALARYPFLDGSRLAATGASYGGHLVNWLQATTDRFRCLIGHAGLISLEGQWATSDSIYHREINNGGPPWGTSPVWRDQSPSTYADRFATPQLLTIGENDYRVPINQTLAAWTYLKRRQVPSRLIVFHDANHWIMKGGDARYFWQEAHAWLAQYLNVPDDLPATSVAESGDALPVLRPGQR
jgi:dipeptidyl aminopeptidase/acylaminoacyl peptidase